jgi:hypothetical protein
MCHFLRLVYDTHVNAHIWLMNTSYDHIWLHSEEACIDGPPWSAVALLLRAYVVEGRGSVPLIAAVVDAAPSLLVMPARLARTGSTTQRQRLRSESTLE